MNFMRLEQACQQLQSAIILGRSWRPALDALAESAGATGALITRSTANRLHALQTPSLDQPVGDILSGRTPPYRPNILILSPFDHGFVSDAGEEMQSRLERVPLFRDYLKQAVGIPFRASTFLAGPRDLSGVRLSFWRSIRQGGFDQDEVRCLDRVLPSLRAAAQVARYGLAQRAEETALMFRNRGEFVFKIDLNGRPLDEDCEAISASGDPLFVSRGRLACWALTERSRLDAALELATRANPQSSTIALTRRRDDARLFLLLLPIVGEAADVLAPASVVGVLVDPSRRPRPGPPRLQGCAAPSAGQSAKRTLRRSSAPGCRQGPSPTGWGLASRPSARIPRRRCTRPARTARSNCWLSSPVSSEQTRTVA